MVSQLKLVRPYYYGDYYPLFPVQREFRLRHRSEQGTKCGVRVGSLAV